MNCWYWTKRWYGRSSALQSRDLFHQVFNRNSVSMEIVFCYNSIAEAHVTAEFCTWHDNTRITRNRMKNDLLEWKKFYLMWITVARFMMTSSFSALLAICAGNSPVPGEFPAQRPVTRNFDVFFDLCLNKRLSKQSWGWWFETPSWSLWRHSNVGSGMAPGKRGDYYGNSMEMWRM